MPAFKELPVRLVRRRHIFTCTVYHGYQHWLYIVRQIGVRILHLSFPSCETLDKTFQISPESVSLRQWFLECGVLDQDHQHHREAR